MRQRAVLFDLDNTLVMEDAATLAAVRSACAVASSRAGANADALYATVPMSFRLAEKTDPPTNSLDPSGLTASA